MGIWGPSENTKTSIVRSTSTHLVLFVSRHSISTKYDQRRHPQGLKTSIITPDKFITIRICCRRVYGVPQKILKHLKESQHQHSLFDLCPGIEFHPHMTTGNTHRNLRHPKLHLTQLLLLDSAASGYLGSYQKL